MAGNKNLVVISLGGSLIVPDQVNYQFLKKFRSTILKHTKRGIRFAIICGGGHITRKYQQAAGKIVKLHREDIDWLGIHITRLNAHLLRTIFYGIAHPQVIYHPLEKISFREKILIAGGWKPGSSTDYDAVLIAKNLGAKVVVNLTDIDYIYDKDPRKFKDARALAALSWKQFRALIPGTWRPGLHTPFDPVASRAAERFGFRVVIMNGKKVRNLDNYLYGRSYEGTSIGHTS